MRAKPVLDVQDLLRLGDESISLREELLVAVGVGSAITACVEVEAYVIERQGSGIVVPSRNVRNRPRKSLTYDPRSRKSSPFLVQREPTLQI